MTLLADIDPAVFDIERLEEAPTALQSEVDRLETQLNSFAEPLAKSGYGEYLLRILKEQR